MPVQPATRLTFGPFEVDVQAREVRRSGLRIRVSPQPFEILVLLLARPGEVVTREELRERIWSDGTFVDFDLGLNSAITKLRRALGDTAENPRYVETHPGRGYRFIGTVKELEGAKVAATELPGSTFESKRGLGRNWWWMAFAAACLLALAVGWRLHGGGVAAGPWKLSRLTRDAGVSDSSAMSRDGKLVAYSWNRDADGWDIYVRQVSGGSAIRLTTDGAGNTSPDFSPDGGRIVYRSQRDEGGIYEIPALGGETRLLARHGLNPKFSPDGSEVAYWVGNPNIAAAVPGGGEVWVVAATGGEPRRVGAKLTNVRYPIWSPDGRHLLLLGYMSNKASDSSAIDWWLAATTGDEVQRTGMYDALSRTELGNRDAPATTRATYPNLPSPGCWLAGSDRLIYSNVSGDRWNLWETRISPRSGKVNGEFKRLTTGAGNEREPSCASGDLLSMTNVEATSDIWSLPYDLDRVKAKGELERITLGPSDREPSLSGDARFVAYSSAQSGVLNIWERELATGKESHIASSTAAQRFPLSNASGSRVAYSAFENGNRLVYISTAGGAPEKMCDACLRPTAWSRDEKTLLIFGGSPYQIDAVDVASHQRSPVVKHATYNLLYGRYSPDGRWISFTARTQTNRGMIVVAPLNGVKPVPQSAWIRIADDVGAEDRASWSPDGKTLYYTSAKDGHVCLWAQRLDPGTDRPVGESFAAQHFHGRAQYLQGGYSAEGGRIAVTLDAGSRNIWMMSRVGGS